MKNLTGPILILLICLLGFGAIKFLRPIIFQKQQQKTSDAVGDSHVIRFGGDDYCGYWFITSPDMRIMAPRKGIAIDFHNDGGAYVERLEKFTRREYDAIVLPINSYLQHGARHKFPGVIVASISESKGADALVAFQDVIPSGKINELNNLLLKIVYTSESPSSFLLDLMISDFGLDQLQADPSWRSEAGSSEEVFKIAKRAEKDRTYGDAFVVWEPYVTRSIEELNMKTIWSSEQFAGYIIDVIVFHRDFIRREPELVQQFLDLYFLILNRYAADKPRMIKEMSSSMHLKENAVKKMTDKIDWFTLDENCNQQFGIPINPSVPANEGIINSIISCSHVMSQTGTFSLNELPDPYLIINSKFLKELSQSSIRNIGSVPSTGITDFQPLDESAWSKLQEIGTMRVEPITFQSGTNRLDYAGKEVVDRVAQLLITNYPNYRIAVRGHTGPGDEKANYQLSLERAKVVLQRLVAVHNIDPDRLHAEGMGASHPPSRKSGESTRSLRLRMPRVEFVLLEREAF